MSKVLILYLGRKRIFFEQREKEKNISHRKHRDFILQREKEDILNKE